MAVAGPQRHGTKIMLKFKQLEPSCADSYNRDMLKGLITVYVLSGAGSQSGSNVYGN